MWPKLRRIIDFHIHFSTGNSTSISHLIDNEIPLAHISANELATYAFDPALSQANGGAPSQLPHAEDMDIVGGVLMENGGLMSNQRSGSYSNLYPEGDLSQVRGVGEAEGHYSNLPQLNISDETRTVRSSIEDVVDAAALASAQQHVYSNINGDADVEAAVAVASGSALNVTEVSAGGAAMSWRADTSSSALIADDMDLDDPSTAFQGKKRTKSAKREKISSDSSISSATSSRKPSGPESTSTPIKSNGGGNKKHIIPIVAVIETSNNVNNVQNCPRPESELNSSKLQMLHDTTMIDCALDLDSLDTVTDQRK